MKMSKLIFYNDFGRPSKNTVAIVKNPNTATVAAANTNPRKFLDFKLEIKPIIARMVTNPKMMTVPIDLPPC